MPKKWKGDNPKAAEARERKEAKKQAELDRKQRAEEDAYWQDDDKHVQKKEQRKVRTVPNILSAYNDFTHDSLKKRANA